MYTFLVVLGLILSLLAIWILNEVSPWRRQQIFDFETTILSILAQQGEMAQRPLRETANSRVGRCHSAPMFFIVMADLEDKGFVEMRIQKETCELEDESFEIKVRYYKLTDSGRGARIERLSALQALRLIPGKLLPATA